jgi:hypothetical protein
LGLVIQHWCEELSDFSCGNTGQIRSSAMASASQV